MNTINEALEAFTFFLERNEVKEEFDKQNHETIVRFVETGEEQCLGCWLNKVKYHK